MNNSKNTGVQVFQLRTSVKVLILFMIVFLFLTEGVLFVTLTVLLIDMLKTHNFDRFLVWLEAVGMTLFFLYVPCILPSALKTQLEFSPEGVTYSNPSNHTIYTPWENIDTIMMVPISPVKKTIGLLLYKPAQLDIPLAQGVQQRQAVIEKHSRLLRKRDLLAHAFSIPLGGCLSKKELESESIRDIFQLYAPHLLKR